MAEATQIEYSLREVAELIVRHRGIKDGHWMILLKFAHTAGNISLENKDDITPIVMNRVMGLGIQRVDEPSRISVDASELSKGTSPARSKARAKAKTTSL